MSDSRGSSGGGRIVTARHPAAGEERSPGLRVWVADLHGLPATDLFRCTCPDVICDYHATDWPLVLKVVLKAFRAEFGDGPADYRRATEVVLPRAVARLASPERELEVAFAISLFSDPMLARSAQWTNGQHRCQAAMDAGCFETLFVD